MGTTRAPAEAAPDAGAPEISAAARAGDALFRPVRAGNAFEATVERLLTAIKRRDRLARQPSPVRT